MRKNFISRAFPDIDTFLNLHIDTILNLYLNTYYTPLYLLVFARSHLAFTFYLVWFFLINKTHDVIFVNNS